MFGNNIFLKKYVDLNKEKSKKYIFLFFNIKVEEKKLTLKYKTIWVLFLYTFYVLRTEALITLAKKKLDKNVNLKNPST